MIELQGYEELLAHSRASYLIHTPLRHFMRDAGTALRQALFRVSPVGKTKFFKRGWTVTIGPGDPPTTVTVANTDPKAPMVIGGTRPHVILPRFKKALFWDGAAHPVRSVFHPGTKPNDVIAKGIAEASSEIAQLRAVFDAEVEARWEKKGAA